jgi:hypothetical protein
MYYYMSILRILLIALQPIVATDQSNNDNSSGDKNCKITKYGVNCPLDVDLKDLIKKHDNKLFAEQKLTFQNNGKIWEVSVAEVDPRLDIRAINDSKLSYFFNHRSDWCIVDFIMEKKHRV